MIIFISKVYQTFLNCETEFTLKSIALLRNSCGNLLPRLDFRWNITRISFHLVFEEGDDYNGKQGVDLSKQHLLLL